MANIDISFSQKKTTPQQSGVFKHYVHQDNNYSQKKVKTLLCENFEIVNLSRVIENQ